MGITYYSGERAVIDSPGDYTITQDLTQPDWNESCIWVVPGTHFVTIRLRSRLEGTGGPGSINAGIQANGCAALTILNDGGSMRGFAYGVNLWDCYLARIERLFVRDAFFRGIKVEGNDSYVADCDIRCVKGATWTPNAYCFGIEVQGIGGGNEGRHKVLRNSVFDVAGVGTGESVGISVSDKGLNSTVFGNVIKNPALIAKSYGLWVGGVSDVSATHNLFDSWNVAAEFSEPPTGFTDDNAFRNCNSLIVDRNCDVSGGVE